MHISIATSRLKRYIREHTPRTNSMTARAISIITYGDGKRVSASATVRSELTEMADQVRKHNGSDPSTQLSLFSQPDFGEIVTDELQNVCDDLGITIVVACCTSGHHRADVFGKVLVSTMNALVDG